MPKIDHLFTENIVCPWCGNETEPTDYLINKDMEGREECDLCGRTYSYAANISTTWVTAKEAEA